jgi:hypothetical protein
MPLFFYAMGIVAVVYLHLPLRRIGGNVFGLSHVLS